MKLIMISIIFLFIQLICFSENKFDYNKINWTKINYHEIELLLPENYIYKISKSEIIVKHFIPYKHGDMCDYVENTILYYLTDLEWRIIVNEGTLKDFIIKISPNTVKYIKNKNEFIIENGFIDKFKINDLNGYIITTEYDGCGKREYFIILKNKILYIFRSHGELGTTSFDETKKYLKLPGVILRENENIIFNNFITNILIKK